MGSELDYTYYLAGLEPIILACTIIALMIPAIVIGRKGSRGLPGKNTLEVLGRPMAEYPMRAAYESSLVDHVFLSTDDNQLKSLAADIGVKVIDRPKELATPEALGEDAFRHAYECVKQECGQAEMVVLLFCNSPTISTKMLDECIKMLRQNTKADSVVSVSKYNMWSPLRARRESKDGYLEPFVPFEIFGDPKSLNCDRDSQGDVWFADMSISVVRPKCLEQLEDGLLPQKWMGQKIIPYKQVCGCDVDYAWQVPMVEWWLKNQSSRETI